MMLRPGAILDERRTVLLRASLAEGPSAIDSYRRWRTGFDLDKVDTLTFRVLPLLFHNSQKLGLEDSESTRMRGVAKHIWLSNTLGARLLVEALEVLRQSGIEAMVMKGGALFARDERLAQLRYTADYDLQVRKRDAREAIAALLAAGFKQEIIRADLFKKTDFDLIHGVHFRKKTSKSSVDLHWRPLPLLHEEEVVDELMGRADNAALFGKQVMIPSVADHLFLSLARPEAWERDEIFLRAVEATLLLRHFGSNLEWDRLEMSLGRLPTRSVGAAILRLIRDEIEVPIPEGLVERLDRGANSLVFESPLRKVPLKPVRAARFALSAFNITQPESRSHLLQLPFRAARRFKLARSAGEPPPNLKDTDLAKIWEQESSYTDAAALDEIAFVRGFSFPEDRGRWTDGDLAVVKVPIEGSATGVIEIQVAVSPFVPPGVRTFDFAVEGGYGASRHRIKFNRRKTTTIVVKGRPVGQSTKKVVLVFYLIDACSPLALGLNSDPRLLGLFVERIERPHAGKDAIVPAT